MADKNCPYVKVLLWEHGGDGVDSYCKAPSHPMDKADYEAPSEPLCDSDNYLECRWFLRQKSLENSVDEDGV